MFEKYSNMGRADRIIRFTAGIALISLGFVFTDIIDHILLNTMVGMFGVTNVLSTLVRVCPAYLLVNFSTLSLMEPKTADQNSDTNPIITEPARNVTNLRRKLLLSIAIPMLALLVIFGSVIFDIYHQYDLSTLSRKADVAAEAAGLVLVSDQFLTHVIGTESYHESAKAIVEFSTEELDLFYIHDSMGYPIESPFNKGVENERFLQASKRLHGSLDKTEKFRPRGMLEVGGKNYIWSIQSTQVRDRWITSIFSSPADHATTQHLLSPRFLIVVFSVLLMSFWSSVYIVKKFLDNIESNARSLRYRTLHDPLTGLPNRLCIENIISEKLKTLNNGKESVTLLMIDVIDFRDINDTLGQSLGDNLLVRIGHSLLEIDPARTDVVKMGGDVFCLVCKTDQDTFSSSRISNEIHNKLECSHDLNGIPVAVQVRVGIASYPIDTTATEELIRYSDIALAKAKSLRLKNCFFQHEHDTHSIRKLTLLARLRTAIDQNELMLVYQPKVNIQNNTLIGVEVLVRWFDDEYGAVSPLEFVNWAERSGLIDNLTRWVLSTAEAQCREWRDRGYVVPFAVNLSPTNLYDKELIPLVAELVEKGSFGNGMLELEITENAVMEDPDKALLTMKRLSNMGVSFAIDDFGTGLSSFAYLRKFPVSNLKIDRAFIIEIDESDNNSVLLKSMIKLGHGLGCVVTAEGVEDQATLVKLRSFGCNYVQGYYVCKPVPADDLIQWIDSSDWLSTRLAA